MGSRARRARRYRVPVRSGTGPAAIVLDFDGLILDTEWTKFVAVSEAFAAHGVELPVDEWRASVGRTDSRHWTDWLADAVGRPIDRDTVYPAGLARHHALLADQLVLPGVVELLDAATDAKAEVEKAAHKTVSIIKL